MTEGREGLAFNPVSHVYEYDGMRVPGVTTVLNIVNGLEGAPADRVMAAGIRGSLVHKATENHDLGLAWDKGIKDDDVRTEVWPYVSAYFAFLDDYRDLISIETIEERLYHPLHQYAGTADRVVLLNGERAVEDIKTAAKLSPATGPQLAAYKDAANAHRPRKEQIERRFSLQLKKDGTYVLKFYNAEDDLAVFLHCLALYRWRIRMGMGEIRPFGAVSAGAAYEFGEGGTWPLTATPAAT